MPILTDEAINDKLGIMQQATNIGQTPLVSQIETITSNIKTIIELITSAKNQTQGGQQAPINITPKYEKMENPDKPAGKEITEARITSLIDGKIGLFKLLPQSIKDKTLKDCVEEYKTNPSTRAMVVKFIKQIIDGL